MDKILDLKESVHELCKKNPRLSSELAELGFKDILKPGMLQSVGRFMTLKKGAALKGLDLGKMVEYLRECGYQIIE